MTERHGRGDRVRLRDWLAAAAIALVVAAGITSLFQARIDGLSLDLDFWLRHHLMPRPAAPGEASAVVVAIDEETYLTPPFKDVPSALWTDEIAAVLGALVAADAKVVGFDVIYPTSVASRIPGFDRNFLLALHNAAKVGKIVLGDVTYQVNPIHPYPAQSFAVGNDRNIRSVNMDQDRDAVIRRVPLGFHRTDAGGGGDAATLPSMSLELAQRAVGAPATKLTDGRMALAGYAIPNSGDGSMILNFPDTETVQTYSFADLVACAQQQKSDFFREHFAGKVVLLGTVLDVEDRKITSSRFITRPERGSMGARCALPRREDIYRTDVVRDTIAGVYIHSTAVNNLLAHNALRIVDPLVARGLVLAATLLAAASVMRFAPWLAGCTLLFGVAAWALVVTAVFRSGLVLPLLTPPIGASIAAVLLLGYRMAITDRARRLLRSSFGLYLSPALINRMVEADRQPELGGEDREVTIFASDIAGFTTLSEGLAPADLVALMNAYLTEMTDIIESEGGFVDKYIGDAILAIFGAPLDDAEHALHAVRAALRCRDRLIELNRDATIFRGHNLRARIGLSTGRALVGNIGSRRRFNYTALGDTVNLGARLEGANKAYGSKILATAATQAGAGDAILWREIDRVRVVGRQEPVTLFEPLAIAATASPEQSATAARYTAALADYRAGRFEAAIEAFEQIAPWDEPAKQMAARSRRWAANPPPRPWDGVEDLKEK